MTLEQYKAKLDEEQPCLQGAERGSAGSGKRTDGRMA